MGTLSRSESKSDRRYFRGTVLHDFGLPILLLGCCCWDVEAKLHDSVVEMCNKNNQTFVV